MFPNCTVSNIQCIWVGKICHLKLHNTNPPYFRYCYIAFRNNYNIAAVYCQQQSAAQSCTNFHCSSSALHKLMCQCRESSPACLQLQTARHIWAGPAAFQAVRQNLKPAPCCVLQSVLSSSAIFYIIAPLHSAITLILLQLLPATECCTKLYQLSLQQLCSARTYV